MIKWYSIKDLEGAYSLSQTKLKSMCKSGELGAMRLPDKRYRNNPGQYRIPESELLLKLSEYKIGEPEFKEEHQPSEMLTPRSDSDEIAQIEELTGNYRKYIDSEHWNAIRTQALKRDGFRCQICGTGIEPRVHHVSYEHLGTEQELDDVVTLCDECHSKVHAKDNQNRRLAHESKKQ